MSQRNLPPLEVGTAYRATDFEYFDYSRIGQGEGKAILRLHMKNKTTIDLPTTDDELKHLLSILVASFGDHAIAELKRHGWI